ncbi:MAG: nuclear transport factor 2 family protein [Gemmatimonadetes bacterium]|nr:nuclear transport factor 2 family protein [Gemmatimonadota bacterium]
MTSCSYRQEILLRPEDFILAYESALATQDWSKVAPLIHEDACVTFSNGSVHRGKSEVKAAFEKNFAAIRSESYHVENVDWIRRTDEVAVYRFDFVWSGTIGGKLANGAGRGTSVLVNENAGWQLIVEHLGPAPA